MPEAWWAMRFINQSNTWLWKQLMLNKSWLFLLDNFSPIDLSCQPASVLLVELCKNIYILVFPLYAQ